MNGLDEAETTYLESFINDSGNRRETAFHIAE